MALFITATSELLNTTLELFLTTHKKYADSNGLTTDPFLHLEAMIMLLTFGIWDIPPPIQNSHWLTTVQQSRQFLGVHGKTIFSQPEVVQLTDTSDYGTQPTAAVLTQSIPNPKSVLLLGLKNTRKWFLHMVTLTTNSQYGSIQPWQELLNWMVILLVFYILLFLPMVNTSLQLQEMKVSEYGNALKVPLVNPKTKHLLPSPQLSHLPLASPSAKKENTRKTQEN